MEDLQIVEHVVRQDPKVIEQCVISGIPREDMHKVYCDREFIHTYRTESSSKLIMHQHGPLATTRGLAAKSDFSKD